MRPIAGCSCLGRGALCARDASCWRRPEGNADRECALWSSYRLRLAGRQHAGNLFLKYGIQPAGWTGAVGSLSGGNQQKFLVARELEQDPALILVAHPTRGVDWRSSQKIHQALVAARARGAGVLLVSSDLDELCALSDRILIMLRGRVVRDFSKNPESGFDVAAIGLAMAGGGAS